MTSGNDTVKIRMRFAAIFGIPIAIALIVRYYVLQVKQHDYYFSEAKKRYTSVRRTEGKWGEILDRDGNLIVGNRPCIRISCAPSEIKSPVKRHKLAHILSMCLGKPADYYLLRLNPLRVRRDAEGKVMLGEDGQALLRPNNFLMLGRTVAISDANRLKSMLAANRIPAGAFSFQDTYSRTYPKRRMLANVLGYVNIVDDATRPQAGLEKQLADETSPETGRVEIERARDGTPLDYGLQNISASRDGKNIYLTISEPVQSILEEELDAAYEKWKPDTLYAAIATPEGDILALAQRPNFDPDDRSTFTPAAIRTRIAEDSLEPGSIMKPFSIAKALDWGVVTPEQLIECDRGRWFYLGKVMTDTHPYDKLTVAQVIQKSSNIGTAKIALMLGEKRVCEALSLFGFGTRTGLPFPLESRGTPPRVREGDKLTVTRIPIGYAIRVTPLQMLRAYCTLANRGRFATLRLIDRVEDPESGEVVREPRTPGRPVFDRPEALKQLIDMMITVTQPGGTATKAAIRGYDVAGKTGTSRKYIPGHGYSFREYFASFVGFVPAHDPKLVMVVTADNPKGASYGGTVSGPVFARTAERVLKLMNVPPDHPETEEKEKEKTKMAASAPKPALPAPKKTPVAAPTPLRPRPETRGGHQLRRPARTASPVDGTSEFPPMAPPHGGKRP